MTRLHQTPAWRANDERVSKCVRHFRVLVIFLVIVPGSILASIKGDRPGQLNGYKAVRVHYGPLNKMIMPVRINGQSVSLLVDTGSNQLILDTVTAESVGVRPSQRAQVMPRQTVQGFRYIRFTQINSQVLPVGFAQSLAAGSMSFGSALVTLRQSNQSGAGRGHIDGVLGLDILSRYKAVINCRAKLIFFKVDQARQVDLSSVAAQEKFARIPLRREENGALTVPCSIRGQPARLFVDTGAFLTIFHEAFLKSVGIPMETTRVSAHFAPGASRKISAGQINDFKIGNFKTPQRKFGVTALPNFTLRQGSARVSGILGMDTLYACHGIIDLDSMNLFLK
jgi:predicted aspartyl protease